MMSVIKVLKNTNGFSRLFVFEYLSQCFTYIITQEEPNEKKPPIWFTEKRTKQLAVV